MRRNHLARLFLALTRAGVYYSGMERIICEGVLTKEWAGASIGTPLRYRLLRTEEELVYRAARDAAPELHPTAQAGQFSTELWRYHCAEFFLAAPEGTPYMEFNLAPNGAWWACVFRAPRTAAEPAPDLNAIRACGSITPQGWETEMRVPLSLLTAYGIPLPACRLAIGAALPEHGAERWLTTTPHDADAPADFHTPTRWHLTTL